MILDIHDAARHFQQGGWKISDYKPDHGFVRIANSKSRNYFNISEMRDRIVFFRKFQVKINSREDRSRTLRVAHEANVTLSGMPSLYLSKSENGYEHLTLRATYPYVFEEKNMIIALQYWESDLQTAIAMINEKLWDIIQK